MIRTKKQQLDPATERKALRRRVAQFYEDFNQSRWDKCFLSVVPTLRENAKVTSGPYATGLRTFQDLYGSIRPWHLQISLHLDGASKQNDARPFAFVYIVWQDQANEFHMFRERWVRMDDRWYSRVAGLVPNRHNAATA